MYHTAAVTNHIIPHVVAYETEEVELEYLIAAFLGQWLSLMLWNKTVLCPDVFLHINLWWHAWRCCQFSGLHESDQGCWCVWYPRVCVVLHLLFVLQGGRMVVNIYEHNDIKYWPLHTVKYYFTGVLEWAHKNVCSYQRACQLMER